MPGPEADLSLLIDAAHAAGEVARRYFRKDPQVWEKSDDAGPVTQADLEIDTLLRERLGAARPAYGWLSEETEDSAARLSRARVFVVDPIDGTRAFIDGQTAFAHSLAVIEDGRPIAGVVYLPMQDRLFAASLNGGATLNEERITAAEPAADARAQILATRPTLRDSHWPGGVPGIERVYRPSLAYRLALVGTGRFQGMVTFRKTWEWDIAAGALIAAEAGAVITDAAGAPLRFNGTVPQVDGVIAASPAVHGDLVQRHLGRPAHRSA